MALSSIFQVALGHRKYSLKPGFDNGKKKKKKRERVVQIG